ncbi:hypothetical protein [Herbaspirillum sp. NPDC087042]|uniref:hypothetical protein n=1 Tax=Herbaspirillum sp. NPDC087042 TaxID=3364004 RepID=UPI0037F4B5EC
MAFSRYALLILLSVGLLLTGCSRSPKEQLAYQHAEEQYQINQRNAERLRDRDESQDPPPAQDESVPVTPVRQ